MTFADEQFRQIALLGPVGSLEWLEAWKALDNYAMSTIDYGTGAVNMAGMESSAEMYDSFCTLKHNLMQGWRLRPEDGWTWQAKTEP